MKPALPEWRGDWLYALVLREAERDWAVCSRVRDQPLWQYVLIEEWSSAREGVCGGKLIRAWIRDAEGLREISLDEHRQHKRRIHGPVYPFVILAFCIEQGGAGVVLGRRQASRAGTGGRYLVVGEGDGASLEPDPTGVFWIS